MVVTSFADWLANNNPPCMAHCAPVEGIVIILEEKLGVCPAGIGETYWRLMAKCVFQVTGPEDKEASVMEQLCTGMEG